jgi:hypothetical protein
MDNTKQQCTSRKLIIEKDSLTRALRVALLVGIILNVINNPVLITLSFSGLNIYKVLLTFLVPFCVSLYSSVIAGRYKCPEVTSPR